MLELNLEELCLHTVNEICAFTALEVQEESESRRKSAPTPHWVGAFSANESTARARFAHEKIHPDAATQAA